MWYITGTIIWILIVTGMLAIFAGGNRGRHG